MEQHDFKQGSPEWHAHRRTHFNASDAPAMLGISPYKTRTQLLDEMTTGVTPEVDEATQRRFDDGHRFEALARPLAEKIIGRALYPVTGSEGMLSASFDGLTSDDKINFEHKSLNDDLRAFFDSLGEADTGIPPDLYLSQIEQQGMVSDCERTLFMASKWGDNGELIEERHCWVERNYDMRQRLMQGWTQFAIDLETHQLTTIAEKPKAEAIMDLPALSVQATGMVTHSNLPEFKAAAESYIANINTNLQTDGDFANAEATVKFCKSTEEKLDLTKKAILAQTATIDEVIRTVEHIQAQLRDKRLDLDKKVKTEKEKRKAEMVADANKKYADHVSGLQAEIAGIRLPLLIITPDFGGAIKGLKSLASMHDALDTALANGKIEADAVAKDIRAKLEWCKEEAAGMSMLFPDLQQIIGRDVEAFKAVIKSRITEHKAAEAAKLEEQRKRMEAEAKAKAEREAAAKMAEEEARIRAEEQAKARAEAVALANREQHASAEFIPAEPVRPGPFARSVSRSIDKALEAGIIMPADAHVIEHEQASSVVPVKPKPSRIELVNCIAERFGVSAYVANDWLTEEFGRQ